MHALIDAWITQKVTHELMKVRFVKSASIHQYNGMVYVSIKMKWSSLLCLGIAHKYVKAVAKALIDENKVGDTQWKLLVSVL